MTTTVQIHLIEKYTHPVYGKIFDGYVDVARNVFGERSIMCAMTEDRASAWVAEIEQRARQWSDAKKMVWDEASSTFIPSTGRLDTVVIRK